MAYDVFLSYARADSDRAMVIKDALEALGLSVFYDIDGIDGGDEFPSVIENEIKAARSTIGVWSSHALSRDWVRRECEIARQQKTLIPVEIDQIEDSVISVAFSKIHRLDLRDFTGRSDHDGWQKTIKAIAKKLGRPDLHKTRRKKVIEEKKIERLAADLNEAKLAIKYLQDLTPGWPLWRVALLGAVSLILLFAAIAWAWKAVNDSANMKAYYESPEWPILSQALDDLDKNAPDARLEVRELLSGLEQSAYLRNLNINPVTILERGSQWTDEAIIPTAWAYYFGEGGARQDYVRSAHLFRKSCAEDLMRGCHGLAVQLSLGKGFQNVEDDQRANAMYQKACDAGYHLSCYALGTQYAKGEGFSAPNNAKANELYELSCNLGAMVGCLNLGIQYDTGKGFDGSDDAQANELFLHACNEDYMPACSALGAQYQTGETLIGAADHSQANSLYKKACDAGHMRGCRNLGLQYAKGRGINGADHDQANELFLMACQNGEMSACNNLGAQYAHGYGFDAPNFVQANFYYQLACDGGNSGGCHNLGYNIATQRGFDVADLARARRVLGANCTAGFTRSCETLSRRPFISN